VPRTGDADFTIERLISRANDELANGLGNLVNRVIAMIHRYRQGRVPAAAGPAAGAGELEEASRGAPGLIDAALAGFDYRQATSALWRIVDEANRYINGVRPWDLARAERYGDRGAGQLLDSVLAALARACQLIAGELAPFLPGASARISRQCTAGADGVLPSPSPVFDRLP
jgi:methionyl-tRNA synthetase